MKNTLVSQEFASAFLRYVDLKKNGYQINFTENDTRVGMNVLL